MNLPNLSRPAGAAGYNGKVRTPERQVVIPTPDGKRIYATLGLPRRRTDKLVLFVHGLAGCDIWPTILLGSWYMRRHGLAYCRINLYDWRPGARTLRTSDFTTHARDTETVVRFLKRRGFHKVFGVGHSFGGLTLLRTDSSEFEAMSLWDVSSFISYPPKKWIRTDTTSGARYLIGGSELLLSRRFERAMLEFPNELELIAGVKCPLQICHAEGKRAQLAASSRRYFRHAQKPKELVAIPGAGHSFAEEGVAELLFARTLRWFHRRRA